MLYLKSGAVHNNHAKNHPTNDKKMSLDHVITMFIFRSHRCVTQLDAIQISRDLSRPIAIALKVGRTYFYETYTIVGQPF